MSFEKIFCIAALIVGLFASFILGLFSVLYKDVPPILIVIAIILQLVLTFFSIIEIINEE